MCIAAIYVRFKIVLDHNSSSFSRAFRIRPIVGIEIVVTEGKFGFMEDFSFSDAGNRDIMVSAIVLP